jgi:hypothetical protein
VRDEREKQTQVPASPLPRADLFVQGGVHPHRRTAAVQGAHRPCSPLRGTLPSCELSLENKNAVKKVGLLVDLHLATTRVATLGTHCVRSPARSNYSSPTSASGLAHARAKACFGWQL